MNFLRRYQDKITIAVLLTHGLIDLTLHPRKTYNLIVHHRGWYD